MRNEKYRFKIFAKYKKISYGISSKSDGSMKKGSLQIDREALSSFAKSIGITGDVICMQQIHSGNVARVEDTSKLRFSSTDGLITNKKHLSLAVLTADCLPVLFYDPKQGVIAAAHAGFKGLLNHILENTVDRFVSDFKSDPMDIIVGIGPGIEMMCYEVGMQRVEEFDKIFPKFENICSEMGGRFFLDLREIALQCLGKEGILKENIEVMNICTKCDPNFYSYRGGDTGRIMSVVSLV